ncbi:hypothetical protein N7474_007731 [Penicillium riverlandense]|uniref:uncharacterized protein n=1 Tax=Penicillium riverlandense TaxID=1903569 RepID=UPI002547E373|nr:uncharacterized protein N7474_007731 [Penicillium riverlandense]KAJ5811430.1 hypothetical protein N7474_007731 [Penicillium riverlandense]
MAGVSLGAHTAWRIASLASPGQFHAYAMVVGCPNLTDLLLSRVGLDPEADKQNIDNLYQRMTLEQQRRWPRSLAEIVHRDDLKVADEFPTDVPLLLCNGLHDRLVPAKYTAAWVEERREKGDQHVTFFVQENTGHSCTKEMVAMLVAWLRDSLPIHSPRPFL